MSTQNPGSGFGQMHDALRQSLEGHEELLPLPERNKERFKKILEGKYKFIPKGLNYSSGVKGVNSVSLLAPPEGGRSMQVIVYGEGRDGREIHKTLSLTPEGVKMGWSKELKNIADPEEVMDEILTTLEKMRLDFWVEIEQEILQKGTQEASTSDSEPNERQERTADKSEFERIDFLASQPGALFGFHTKGGVGFNGYRGFVFDGFVILESPFRDNAAYIIDGTPQVPEEGARMTEEQKGAWVKEHMSEVLEKTRGQLRDEGTQRILHQGDWKDRMQQAIAERLR